MRLARPSPLVAPLLLLAAACATGSVAAPPAPGAPASPASPPPPRPASPAGFDTYYYPGDVAMRAWRTASPYAWVGYYLPAPCHREASWQGRRATLADMGWEIAVLFVGQQTWEGQAQVAPAAPPPGADTVRVAGDSAAVPAGPPAAPACAPSQLTAARGAADGADAAARAAAEGFAARTTIFLDVERMERVPAAMEQYVRAWVRAVAADGRYRAGLYAHARNVAALHDLVRAELAAAGAPATVPVWVASSAGFDLVKRPEEVGHPFATVWQGAFDLTETWNGVTLRVDANVAATPSPSAPAAAATPAPATPP